MVNFKLGEEIRKDGIINMSQEWDKEKMYRAVPESRRGLKFFLCPTLARLFTVMGLVLNAELISPYMYVAFILVVIRNMYLRYSNLQSKDKEVKGMISKQWKENTRDLPGMHSSSDETIPKNLLWFVCGKRKSRVQQNVLLLRAELCFMLRDMTLILVFLFLSLYTILMFQSMNDMSALVSTIFVFVSGVIPSLILAGFTTREI